MAANPYEPPKGMEKLKRQSARNVWLGALFGLLSLACAITSWLATPGPWYVGYNSTGEQIASATALPELVVILALLTIPFAIAAALRFVWALLGLR